MEKCLSVSVRPDGGLNESKHSVVISAQRRRPISLGVCMTCFSPANGQDVRRGIGAGKTSRKRAHSLLCPCLCLCLCP